jgi:hypothetical protein
VIVPSPVTLAEIGIDKTMSAVALEIERIEAELVKKRQAAAAVGVELALWPSDATREASIESAARRDARETSWRDTPGPHDPGQGKTAGHLQSRFASMSASA